MDETELLITLPQDENTSEDLQIGLPDNLPEILITPNICVMGVGGAGGNAINNMIESGLKGARFVVANTDAQIMTQSLTHERIQLGATLTKGLGAGSLPEIGKAAAEESAEKIKEVLQGINLLFIAAGMGKGTGTGASPVIAKIAKEMGILTIGVVTKPFNTEGSRRMKIAEAGIEELSKYIDTLITIPNQNLFYLCDENTTFDEAFKMADDILYKGVKNITDLMMKTMKVQVDFADFKTITENMGKAIMGSGEASGPTRAIDATEKAINNPLFEVSMKDAKGVLISLMGKKISLMEQSEVLERIQQEVQEDANIIYGIGEDETLDDKIRVSIVATGLECQKANKTLQIEREINARPEPIIVNPTGNEEKKEDLEQKPSAIFVPAPHANVQDIQTLPETSVDNTLNKIQTEESFIPNPAIEVDLDENEMKESDTKNDLFGSLLESVLDEEKSNTEVQQTSEIQEAPVKEKRRRFFGGDFFPLFSSKDDEEIIKKNKERIEKENKEKMNNISTPVLPDENDLAIPPFIEQQEKEKVAKEDPIPNFFLR
ncbi:MAG: cell division protein FtsZ [Alphaproteobacteria bacterium]|nr:cell division protein FtsZ [Alphaproteobacteria bacterium]